MQNLITRIMSAALLFLTGFIFSCSDSEPRIPLNMKTAHVIIDLGLPADSASNDVSIIDRVLRFFARDAVAQTAPAIFESVLVRVAGPDFGLIEKTFAWNTSISLDVPAGDFRSFEVIAYVAPGQPTAATSFRGTAIVNLPAGKTVSVPIIMGLNETHILVPDYAGNKIVLMDAFTWRIIASKSSADIVSTYYTLRPYDIDFDSRGRIYIASNTSGASGGIFRMNDINSTYPATCVKIADSTIGIRSVAVDKIRNKLYYVDTGDDLWRVDLGSGISEMIAEGTPATERSGSVCVDEASGNLYVSYTAGTLTSVPFLGKFNPNIETPAFIPPAYPLNTHGLSAAFDVTVKNGYLYASFIPSGQIIRLPLDFLPTTEPNTLSQRPGGGYTMFGPHMFIAIPNRKLYFIDELEGSGVNTDESIIAIDDITGSGWSMYRNTSGVFQFYSSC